MSQSFGQLHQMECNSQDSFRLPQHVHPYTRVNMHTDVYVAGFLCLVENHSKSCDQKTTTNYTHQRPSLLLSRQ